MNIKNGLAIKITRFTKRKLPGFWRKSNGPKF